MIRIMTDKGSGFIELTRIMARLRSPDGCPWDLKQTMKDLKVYLIDEAYEVLEAIDSEDRKLLCEELGDLLFQIVFLARLAEEEGAFDMDSVIQAIEEKMIRRHPHVFGKVRISSAAEVMNQWEDIKVQEGKPPRASRLSGVPRTLPALYRAHKMGLRASRVGFDWDNPSAVMLKAREELSELGHAVSQGEGRAAKEELGDLLFTLANLARHLDLEPEETLRVANEKFLKRFKQMEKLADNKGLLLDALSMAEKEELWETVKSKERSNG